MDEEKFISRCLGGTLTPKPMYYAIYQASTGETFFIDPTYTRKYFYNSLKTLRSNLKYWIPRIDPTKKVDNPDEYLDELLSSGKILIKTIEC